MESFTSIADLIQATRDLELDYIMHMKDVEDRQEIVNRYETDIEDEAKEIKDPAEDVEEDPKEDLEEDSEEDPEEEKSSILSDWCKSIS